MTDLYDIALQTIDGSQTTMADYRGKLVLVVNTASRCGFTPQYAGLEALYRKYKDQGFVVLGFPCNQFGAQEPGEGEQIAEFCEKNYGVSFPLFAKVEVNGAQTHPLFAHLKREAPGLLGSEMIKWNFTKFLLDRQGKVVARYASITTADEIESAVIPLIQS
jgi:glutathione peroxidase